MRRVCLLALAGPLLGYGEGISYADKGLAAAYQGLTFTAEARYPGSDKPGSGTEGRHTAVWVSGGAAPEELARLCAFAAEAQIPLSVYPLTDNVDGSRLAPAYDELLRLPAQKGAYIQCYPWGDESEIGYGSKSWEIDSYLYQQTEILPVFHPGSRTIFHSDWRTPQASANSVLVSDHPAETAIAAFRMRERLKSRVVKPSGALVRAALAADQAAHGASGDWVVDRLVCRQDEALRYVVTTTNAAPLAVTLAWIDPGTWSFAGTKPAATTLAIDLDLEVSCVWNGLPQVWRGGLGDERDTTHALETVALAHAAPTTYLITIRGTSVPELDAGGAVALVVRGAFEGTVDRTAKVRKVSVEVAGSPVGAVEPVPGVYELPADAAVRISPASYAYALNAYGEAYARYPLAGVETNALAEAAGDLAVTVRWQAAASEYRLRKLVVENGDFASPTVVEDLWLTCGTNLVVRLPASAPRGEAYVRDGVCYRAGGIGYGFVGDTPWEFAADYPSFRLETGYDFTFTYYREDDFWYSARIPDYWLSRYLQDALDYGEVELYADEADPDGDGFTNYEEYVANTDPLDREDRLVITAISPEGLTYRGGRDRRVRRESTSSLTAPIVWQEDDLAEKPKAGRFYRLRVDFKPKE